MTDAIHQSDRGSKHRKRASAVSRRPKFVRNPDMVAVVVESSDPPRLDVLWGSVGVTQQPSSTAVLAADLPKSIGRFTLQGVRTFDRGQISQAEALLREHKVAMLLRVVSASKCVTRVVSVPELESAAPIDKSSLASALPFIAESEAPGTPGWRRAAGLLPRMHHAARHAAVVSIWPTADSIENNNFADWGGGQWVSEPVALAGAGHIHAGTQLIARADEASGAISIVAQGESRTIVRTARLASAGSGSWSSDVSRTIGETADAAGVRHGEITIDDGIAMIASDDASASAPTWMQRWGLAVGVLAIWASDDETVRSLATLSAQEPIPVVHPIDRIVSWIAHPRNAAVLIAAATAIMVLVPMGSAWARVQILEDRAKAAKLTERLAESEKRVGFYDLLRERRWPMAKLIADVSGSAPVGIELESLELAQGETVTIRGTAQKADLVAKFRENLAATKVFSQLATPSVESGSGVRFLLTAKVIGNGALYQGKWAEDFTSESLGQRLYGKDWQPASEHAHAFSDHSSSRRRGGGGGGGEGRASGEGTRSQATSRAAAPFVVPQPLTDADIAKMDRTTAMKEFGMRKNAAGKVTDPADKQRLLDEVERVKVRMQQARSDQPPASSGGGQ